MNKDRLILALLIVSGLIFMALLNGGIYQIQKAEFSDVTAIWRINKFTGRVSLCVIEKGMTGCYLVREQRIMLGRQPQASPSHIATPEPTFDMGDFEPEPSPTK